MSTARPFAYNPSLTPIEGTIQVGDLAIGSPITGFTDNPTFWNGPDEDEGYVIAVPVPDNTQPTPLTNNKLFLSPTYKAVDISLSNNNQTATQVFSYQQSVLGETLVTTDKVMFSVQFNSTNPTVGVGGRFIGMGKTDMNYQGPFNGYPGNDNISTGFSDDGKLYFNGQIQWNNLPTWTSGDIIDIAVDGGLGLWWIRVNGGFWCNDEFADPTTNTGGFDMTIGDSYPVLCPYIFGSMTIQNKPIYGGVTDFTFLGRTFASIKFLGTKLQTNPFDDLTFITLVNESFNQSFTSAIDASVWLTTNGYWNSYSTPTSPVLSLDAANYSGSGPWIDSIGGMEFNLIANPHWSSDNGGYFAFVPALLQCAVSNTSLPSLSTWSVGVWHYYDGTNTGSLPCIVTETFIGGSLNYSLGNNTGGGLSSGFFNGGWQISGTYSLTPGNWYYIVGTYDGSVNKLYVNNTLVTGNNYTYTPITSGAGIRLMERWDSNDYWGGNLAMVDIYDTALSQTEITSKWNMNKSRFGL